METFARLDLPRLFDTVRFHIDGLGNPNEYWYHNPAQAIQVHTACGASFCWSPAVHCGMGGVRKYDGDHYHCPGCGAEMDPYMGNNVFEGCDEKDVPYAMELEAKDGRGLLDLVIRASTVKFFPQAHDALTRQRVTARIRFDFRAGRATYWTRCIGKWILKEELQPFECAGPASEDTLLAFLLPCAHVQKETRKALDGFMKEVCARFREKLEEKAGYRVTSCWTPGNAKHGGRGLWTRALDNLVWRLARPDAPNLTYTECTADERTVRRAEKFIERSARMPYLAARRKSFILPKTAGRIPMFRLSGASRLYRAAGNADVGARLVARYFESHTDRMTLCTLYEAAPFLALLSRLRGAEYMERFLGKMDERGLLDSFQTYKLLRPDARKKFWRGKLRARDVHAALTELYEKQVNVNARIEYTEADKKLAGEECGFVFTLPPDTEQLRVLGRVMKNCVFTYRGQLLNGTVRIVAAFKDKRPVLCIEVKGHTVMQAKLPCNAPAARDGEALSALREWARARGLSFQTRDVETVCAGSL